MLVILFNVIWLLNLSLVLLKRQNKVIALFSMIIAIYTFLYNTGSNDYHMYEAIYELKNTSEVEVGFKLLITIARFCGISFGVFQGLIGGICLSINLWIFGNYSKNYNLFFTLYFISQFFTDVNLLRNCIMRTLVLLSFYYLMNSCKTKAIITLLITVTIHRATIFYLIFLLYDVSKDSTFFKMMNIKKRKVLKYAALLAIYICTVNYILGNKWILLRNLAKLYLGNGSGKFDYYFSTTTRFGFLIYFILFGTYFLIIYYSKNKVKKYNMYKFSELTDWIYYINLFVILSFPMMMINLDFHRLANGIYFINIVYFAVLIESSKKNLFYYLWVLVLILCNYLWRLPIVQGWDQKFLILAG
ncbi:EpsG family protein [uncultured Ruminococcus sp.]|uniref:EpsG family protein n=1 Tax=uncultured Ruminococcus sp. TaxID=165186 RepID=UPI0025D75C28|nr:EpsG family protein [uncultured Ruminococcus sp.]